MRELKTAEARQLRLAKTKARAARNRTITLSESDKVRLRSRLLSPIDQRWSAPVSGCRTVQSDWREWIPFIVPSSVDLLVLDPPYNLTKTFEGMTFRRRSVDDYTEWFGEMLTALRPLLKETASVYICGDWFSSASICAAASRVLQVRNKITWEREKGRGAKANWKNSSEDIWFCTVSDEYTFNLDAVRVRRRVVAPYTDGNGEPKDWTRSGDIAMVVFGTTIGSIALNRFAVAGSATAQSSGAHPGVPLDAHLGFHRIRSRVTAWNRPGASQRSCL